jgi:hypothetical protein
MSITFAMLAGIVSYVGATGAGAEVVAGSDAAIAAAMEGAAIFGDSI